MDPIAPSPAAVSGGLRPHRPLPAYYGDEVEHRRFLQRIFDDTAVDYDRVEGVLALGSGRWYRRQALARAGLGSGMQVLDVGCGTGLLTREALALVGPAGEVVGVDPSPGMMGKARLQGARLLVGRAEAIPLPDASVDFLCMGYALRHIDDVDTTFAEFRRVLRPGGRLLVLEITRPAGALGQVLLKAYMRGVVPALAQLVARRRDTALLWRYYWDTIEACISPAEVLAALARAGLAEARREVSLGIFSEYVARRPAA
ncbi:MAG: class I SAM-dependent methyltransferase [Comamonadaceae bacterium]|nr:class I SAM-dependent methyltransferase [Comamonadaceae bacterium]